MSANEDAIRAFESHFYDGELNRFVGSGGEVLVKQDSSAPEGRLDIGDRLIGIGVTHLIENLGQPPGPDAFRAMPSDSPEKRKIATRAFRITAKDKTDDGYDFGFEPLDPEDYAATLETVSEGAVTIPAEAIPKGTVILSFIDVSSRYTLRDIEGSPGANWAGATSGVRHWNVGFGAEDDFWAASFPSDDIGLLTGLPPSAAVGSISFGLSLLPESQTTIKGLEPVPALRRSGETTMHDFCLEGAAAGTMGLATPFPIGLRTAIVFRPQS